MSNARNLADNLSSLLSLASRVSNLSALADNKAAIDSAVAAPGFSNIAVLTASSGTWTVPAGVTKVKITVVGGGGGGAGSTSGGNGGVSAVSGIAAATGGSGGFLATTPGPGGVGSTGTLLFKGQDGNYQSQKSPGGLSFLGGSYGAGGASSSNQPSGGGGGTAVAYTAVTPGASLSYSVGAGGTAGTGATAGNAGVVIIEY